MSKKMTVAEFFERAVELSGKSQTEIAREAGYPRANVISMMKKGQTKIPIERVPGLAKATGVSESKFMSMVLSEYMPEAFDAIKRCFGEFLEDEEMEVVRRYRSDARKGDPSNHVGAP